jgi:ubiquitin C-terminal hydrolase
MPKQTKKSQDGRPVKCSRCYVDMKQHLVLDGGWDWLCPKCGLRHTSKQDLVVVDVFPDHKLSKKEMKEVNDYIKKEFDLI